jgi:16S rRNA (cytosine1402-N4)-methyltransferase
MRHIPVLLNETIEALRLKPGDNVIDCTLGDGGHAEAVLEKTSPGGLVLGIDADPESLLRAKRYLYRFEDRLICVRDNFKNLKEIVEANTFGPVNGIIMDLGWSTPQFDERGRGFSFEKDEPLDMRYTPVNGDSQTAEAIVNGYSPDELTSLFKRFGEEDLSAEIVKEIVVQRKLSPIKTTGELTALILKAYRTKLHTDKEVPWIGGIHPATKVFQALRIEVNQELEVIKQALPQAIEIMAPGARLAVIAFHSLEDRIVKHYFQTLSATSFTLVNKKPIVASEEELGNNRRARSAKLRIIEKI